MQRDFVFTDCVTYVSWSVQGLMVDQISEMSFCALDRNHEKGLSYICRDSNSRGWMCHGFMAVKDSVSGQNV